MLQRGVANGRSNVASTSNVHNRDIYRLYAPVYDLAMRPLFTAARQRAAALLDLQANERVLLPGIGTGLDLAVLPPRAQVFGGDLSPAMLRQARAAEYGQGVMFEVMDATALAFADGVFDAVLLSLILTVVPDGRAAAQEAWRVLRPGGRMVILDKFLPEGQVLTPLRRNLGAVIAWLGTDPNRRLSDLLPLAVAARVELDEPSLLGGQYRIIRIRKPLISGS
jgi:phosphatidylethanolamine/phosphatidyl-N-methylethanolamine N-methyltransferase